MDATTSKDTLYNNKDDNNGLKGLVVSVTSRELTCVSIFLDFEGVEVMVVVVVAGKEVRFTWFEHVTIFYDISTASVQCRMV